MTNKTTKRALLTSVMALFLCFTMLLGTTYAWFTDSVASANNIIKSGNLDIGVYYAYPSDVVNGDVPAENWKHVTADQPLFNNDALWEPGYTEAVFLKFVNEGTLALQYQLKIDILAETLGTNVAGNKFQLSNYINAYACNSFEWNYADFLFTTRDDAIDPAGAPEEYYDTLYNAANGDVATPSGDNPLSLDSWQWLEPTETTYATLVLWMPTTVGNDVNYKTGTTAPQIDLGVTVLAAQYTYEEDSFGKDYDAGAEYPEYVLPVSSEFVKGAYTNPEGNSIKGDITNIVFGKPADYPEIVNNYTALSVENDVSIYQVEEQGKYTLYYLSEGKIKLPANSTGMFRDMTGLTVFDGTNLDMSNVTTVEYMFRNSKNLTEVKGAETWDMSNVTNAKAMFYECTKLETIDVSNWDVSNVENAGWMFYYCQAVTELDVSNWDTSSLTFAKSMFCNNENVSKLEVDNWDMSNVTDTSYMFFRCYKLEDLNVSEWDVSSITVFESMFKHARSVEKLDLSKWDTSSAVNMNHMFANCGGLVELDISGFDTSKVTTMAWMFYEIEATTIYVGDKWSLASIANLDEGVYSHKIATAPLVGGAGTTCRNIMDLDSKCVAENGARVNATARYMIVDGGTSNPGLLTYKAN